MPCGRGTVRSSCTMLLLSKAKEMKIFQGHNIISRPTQGQEEIRIANADKIVGRNSKN